jgi:hypothetical protein
MAAVDDVSPHCRSCPTHSFQEFEFDFQQQPVSTHPELWLILRQASGSSHPKDGRSSKYAVGSSDSGGGSEDASDAEGGMATLQTDKEAMSFKDLGQVYKQGDLSLSVHALSL